jgi:hypothetical protein
MRTNTKFVERRYRFRTAAGFTAGGIETLSVSREAGQPLIPNQGEFVPSSRLSSLSQNLRFQRVRFWQSSQRLNCLRSQHLLWSRFNASTVHVTEG